MTPSVFLINLHNMDCVPTVVYFHDGCADGSAGAWAFSLKYPKAKLVGIKAGCATVPLEFAKGQNVAFVDVCPGSVDEILRVVSIAKSVWIFDHHETSKKLLDTALASGGSSTLHVTFDMTRCGALIAWDALFPLEPRPWFLEYVDDRDRWQWALPNSKDINTGLFEGGWQTIDGYDKLFEDTAERALARKAELCERGVFINSVIERELVEAVDGATPAIFKVGDLEWRVWLGTGRRQHRSEIGNRLSNKPFLDGTLPCFSATWCYGPETDEWWISLRGTDHSPSLVDVCATFPAELKGGGHARAAGVTIPSGQSLRTYFTPIKIKKNV